MTHDEFLALIRSDEIKNVILDTDAYNEVDDQYCLSYLMRSPEKVRLLSINAAPFFNRRSTSPADGMEKSYQEIFKVMNLVDPEAKIPVYRGATDYLASKEEPRRSDASDNIVNTVMNTDEPVIIIAIGAITNVASALIQCPELAGKAALIWLGGHALHYKHTREFNLVQDIPAAQVVLDSGIPMVVVPCEGVCTEFVTTVPELEYYLRGKNALCDYLVDNVARECNRRTDTAPSRIIWDVTAAAVLLCRDGYDMVRIPRPILTSDGLWANDPAREHYFYVRKLKRDAIYWDLFRKLAGQE